MSSAIKNNFGVFTFLIAFKLVKSGLESYITGGDFAQYEQYPHSVFLKVACRNRCVCGGSLLNQNLVLTAAHCLDSCNKLPNETVEVRYGHENIKQMNRTKMKDFMLHQLYNSTTVYNDIAMVITEEEIPLNDVVKRIILMDSPPAIGQVYVAGWGHDENNKSQLLLKHTDAFIQELDVCKLLNHLPDGAFCAGPIQGLGAASKGDSGSALIINNYIQIGLVSYKVKRYSLVAYTNVSYFLDWIKDTAQELFCRNKREY